MSATRLLTATILLALLAGLTTAAAPPPKLHLAKWIEDLGSENDEVWKKANDNLWAAGDRALPALRAAVKDADPDVALRATVLVSRIEWGIYPDTPAAVVAE